jgi:dienelactone hydrolase
MLVLPQAGNFDLEAETLWQMEHPLGTIEKVVFQSEPGAHVVAYVCLPANVQPPYQYWICMQGHSTGAHVSIGRAFNKESETIVVEGDRDYGLECMRRGYAAICIEQRGFGERSEKLQSFRSDNFCHDASMQALLLGRTLMGQRVTDVDRTIDYLQSRGDALMDRIGVLGNSGGGTTSIFSAALLARVAYAMPSCSVCTMRSSLLKIFHCSCNFIPGLLAVAEIGDILGLAAPKPVVVIAGKTDSIFPIDGTREAFAQIERIYQAAGAGDRCRLVEGPEGHRFYAELGWEQMEKLMKNPSQTRN